MSAAAPSYQLRIKRSAEKELNSLPKKQGEVIIKAILELESDPRPRGSRRLRASDGYRIRQGQYRILYTIDERAKVVEVVAVGHRRDVYRGI